MKIKLVDLDNDGQARPGAEGKPPFPNLALMKLSAWHRSRGDQVTRECREEADQTYVSCVFPWNASGDFHVPDCKGPVRLGGSGFWGKLLEERLPDEVEHVKPDYPPEQLFSMGFTSRGCPRRCPWCIVPKKEGEIKPWAEIYEFWDHRHPLILLLDNNLLAAPNWRETMSALAREPVAVDFHQGLDIRLVTDEVAWWLSRVKTWALRFSFDDWAYHRSVEEGLELLVRHGIPASRCQFYVLLGYRQSPEEDFQRLQLLADRRCTIFPMIYRSPDGKLHPPAPGPIPKKMRGNRDSIRKLARMKGLVS